MTSMLLLIVCLALGALAARISSPPASLAQGLNWWVLNVALPALVLSIVSRLELSADLWFPAVAMWAVFLVGWLAFTWLGGLRGWSRARIGALTLTCGLGNSSFVGYPLIEALRGREALPLAAVADQAGVFVAFTIGGTLVATVCSGRSVAPGSLLRRVLSFPAFLALSGGLVAGRLGGWPPLASSVLDRLGDTLVPLALFSVGLQLRLRVDGAAWDAIVAGLAWKLVLAPLMVWGTALGLGIQGPVMTITVLQAAMAPMISAAILAQQHDLEPELARTVLGIGILLSLASVPAANHLLQPH